LTKCPALQGATAFASLVISTLSSQFLKFTHSFRASMPSKYWRLTLQTSQPPTSLDYEVTVH